MMSLEENKKYIRFTVNPSNCLSKGKYSAFWDKECFYGDSSESLFNQIVNYEQEIENAKSSIQIKQTE